MADRITRWQGCQPQEDVDALAPEEPLEIRLAGRPLTVTMRSPGHDDELAAGLLYAQGLLRARTDLGGITAMPEQPNRLDVALSAALDAAERWRRYTFASSSCGICGVESIEALVLDSPPITSDVRITADALYALPALLRAAQTAFGATGGTHAAGLFTADGTLLAAREDVGRHNAVDKVIGYALLRDLLPLDRHVLVVSGRISYEIVQKALAAGIPLLAAVSAPTDLAVRVAGERGLTLIGFLRGERMNVYTHHHRVIPPRVQPAP